MATTPNLGLTYLEAGLRNPEVVINEDLDILDLLFGAAWTAYTPVVTAGSGTFTTVTPTGRYIRFGKTCVVRIRVAIVNKGTATVSANITLPFTAHATNDQNIPGAETTATGKTLNGIVISNTAIAITRFYDLGDPIANGNVLTLQGVFETA